MHDTVPLRFGIGRPVRRTEDPRLLRGQGRFVDDLAPREALHAVFVRSPHAHARIVSIDVGAARATLGVVAVVTPDVGGGFGMRNHAYPEHVALLHAAQALGAPVRWQAERTEGFTSDSAGRDHEITVELALDAEARLTATRWSWAADLGAYGVGFGPAISTIGGPRIVVGPDTIPLFHVRSEASSRRPRRSTPVAAPASPRRPMRSKWRRTVRPR
jgi:CO/xanthine dehydrogenase Mo-binding subunit